MVVKTNDWWKAIGFIVIHNFIIKKRFKIEAVTVDFVHDFHL